MDELTIVRIRTALPDTFTTADIRQESKARGITEERPVIDWLIDHGHIKRTRVGHYEKTNRYKGEV